MKRPFLIGIGGTQSGCGKTTFASAILKHFTNMHYPERKTSFKRWGAIKYTKTSASPVIITDRSILMEKGKDTWQMLSSGAEEVVWVKSSGLGLNEILPDAIKRLSRLDCIIVEGNSAIEFLKPDIVIFILSRDRKAWKEDIERLIDSADIIFYETRSELPGLSRTKKLFYSDLTGEDNFNKFIETIIGLIHERKPKR